jgi:dyslexia susceptibility 1 candidate gene 1 protein
MDDIISSCLRGIKIIKNFRNKVISFEKSSKDSKEKLINFEVRFLIRRGNAYLN